MTPLDRARVIEKIHQSLAQLEADFPTLENVPEERRVIVISTSLIEAGVDLDFFAVFRELTGLDSILQAGGRCNREGKRKDDAVFLYERPSGSGRRLQDERYSITKGIMETFPDLSAPEAVAAYYDRLFFVREQDLTKHTISRDCTDIRLIPFATYCQSFQFIDGKTESIAVRRDEESERLYETARQTGHLSSRSVQKYCCSVYESEVALLKQQGVLDDFGTGIFWLTNSDYYSEEIGIVFEGKDLFF
jgi:CRISPR-associated endonuclease/helicase Cas3